ncbi:hypothetical protein FQN54_009488 [Arachnomyces sp. PD_36]|nr:hypothetical protein FQN54_009488 [Arachnomyces sp. PD_36]
MEANGIYVILSVAAVEYHWGIYVADDDEGGIVHHANNATALALRVGTIPLPQGHAQIDHILGNPNMISQTPGFRCRAWTMDGVARLHNMGVVNAPDISEVMTKAYELADANRVNIEQGTGKYVVASL